MKKLFTYLLSSVVFFLCVPLLQIVKAEKIDQFNTDITINKDGTILVQEEIFYDFGSESRHGIYREIPYIKINADGKKYALTIDHIQVTDVNAREYTWTKQKKDGNISLKIGDANKTITGKMVYKISYLTSGAVTYFSDHDELYWNATGNDWNIPIVSAVTRVQLPVAPTGTKCFTGQYTSTDSECTASIDEQQVLFRSNVSLPSQSGMSIVVTFPKNIIATLEPKEVRELSDNPLFQLVVLLGGIVWYLGLPILLLYRWIKNGRDPKAIVGVTSAWFDPPKTKSLRKLTPAETGTLYDEQADFSDIAATVVDLARRGYLIISEDNKGKYTLKKTSPPKASEPLLAFEKTLYEGMFKSKEIVNLSTAHLSTVVETTKNKVYEAVVAEGYFHSNPQTIRTTYTVLSVLAFFTGNILLAVSAAIFGRNMVKRTMEGANAKSIAQSLKNFLKSQERQFAYQGEKKLLFEKLLPYAVAFGVEKEWANRFADMNIPEPSWYQGSGNNFNSVLFVTSLSHSLGGLKTAATPTSSSSGYSSGMSGGFSGGGGGGGGGGSW